MKRKNLGELLLEMGVIDELQLSAALAHHRQWGVPLGRALVEKRLCGQDHILKALQHQTGLPLISLRNQKLQQDHARLLPLKVAQTHRVVPLRLEGKRAETLVIAIAAPATLGALDAVQQVSGKQRVVAHLASDEDIGYGLSVVYGVNNPFEAALSKPRFGVTANVENEHEFDIDEEPTVENTAAVASDAERPAVLLYGWPAAPAEALMHLISEAGLEVRTVTDDTLSAAKPTDVVLAPLPSLEAAVGRGIKPIGRLVVAGKDPEEDLPRAQKLSACGFVPAPLESAFVLHVLRRVQKREVVDAVAASA